MGGLLVLTNIKCLKSLRNFIGAICLKRIFICAILLLSVIHVKAFNYKKFIEAHDVDEVTMSLKSDKPLDFWESLTANNLSFQKFLENISIGNGKEAQRKVASFPRFNAKYRPEVILDMDETCDKLAGCVGKTDGIELCVVSDNTVNAFAAYSDRGMAVVLNSGIFSAKGVTPEIIIGIVAHEYAHCWLLHILQSEYTLSKRERRNKILAGVSAGLNAAAAGADAYASATLGTESNTEIYSQNILNLEKDIADDLYKYYFRYGREQEFEADLVAYRFMEWTGYGGEYYIEALKIIEANSRFSSMSIAEDDTHPTLRDRIAFLTFVRNNPDIKNTKNKKLSNKKKKREMFNNDDIYK